MMNFIASSMRRFGLAPKNKSAPDSATGGAGGLSKSPIAHMQIADKWSFSTLQYPSNIQGQSDMGHYMMFYPLEVLDQPVPRQSTYGGSASSGIGGIELFGAAGASVSGATKSLTSSHASFMKDISSGLSSLKSAIGTSKKSGGAVGNYDVKGNTWKPGETNKKMDPRAHQGTSADSRNKTRTKWNNKSIILYMPPQLTVNYNAAWKEQELGGNVRDIVKLGQQAVDNFTGPGGKVSMDSMADGLTAKAGGQLVKGGLNVLANTLDRTWKSAMAGAGMDIGGAIDKTENQAINNFLETMFTGISHRKFSYTWKFAPKNAEEMKTVQEIIHTFKYHMLPDRPKDGQWGRYWVVPDEFDIFYMFRGEENQWLNKINTCVLINMDINYTPQQYQTFRPMVGKKGAPPTEIDMKLDFMETKLVTKTEVMDGF